MSSLHSRHEHLESFLVAHTSKARVYRTSSVFVLQSLSLLEPEFSQGKTKTNETKQGRFKRLRLGKRSKRLDRFC